MFKKVDRQAVRTRKHLSIRNKISGTADRPRLSVYRSNNNIFAQLIDDVTGTTIVSSSTLDKDIKTKASNKEAAKEVGAAIAKKAIEKGAETVVFDRGGFIYQGKIQALADAAREAGLKF